MDSILLFFISLFALLVLTNGVRVLREYERGVVFFLGRFYKVKGPGLIVIIPILQQMVKVTKRTIVLDVPPQDLISKDNISVRVNAVVYFKVEKPELAINNVEDYYEATSQLSQTTLRSILGQHDLDEMLSERDKLNHSLQSILDKQTDKWGIKISAVEIKDIDLSEGMIRAIARQAEAERERRAKIINAEGELQSATMIQKAAKILAEEPNAMQLRYLQALTDVSNEKSSTIVFPLPIELAQLISNFNKGK
ncbi:MAG: slipin family protein [Gammaproteobacteria bacterium]|nr:slipin family protein [Gammaproteobacteria bacterium]